MNDFLDIDDSNFDIFSNTEGEANTETTTEKKKRTFDAQKTADTITALGSAGASIYGTVKAFQDPNKVAQRKSLREVCGLKPIAGKNKAKYNDCKKAYESAQAGRSFTPTTDGGFLGGNTGGESTGMSTTTKVILGVLGLAVVGYVGYTVFKGKTATVTP